MKLISYKTAFGNRLAVQSGSGFIDVEKTSELRNISAPASMDALISEGAAGLGKIRGLLSGESVTLGEFEYAPVVEAPEKILCVGLNYFDHRKECDDFPKTPEEPVIFSKCNNALAAHGEKIALSPAAVKYDYEAELVIVIGKTAQNVSESEAADYIFGYTVGNDLSARDLQFRSGQWLVGKSMDKFAPVGPCVVTADSLDPSDLAVVCRMNGETRQSARTSDMMFSCAQIVSYLSKIMTLKPCDLIFTGTPAGVILGMSEDKQRWIKAGDVVEAEIEGIGTLASVFE